MPTQTNERSSIKERLLRLQSSYSESFSIHGLTRIIYSGRKQRVLWCVIFIAAVVGLGYMSKGIVEHFWNKDVRTEMRMEQRKKQSWPSITICPQVALLKHFSCHNKVNISYLVPPSLCSNRLAEDSNTKYTEVKNGCHVYNPNGTLIHVRFNKTRS